MIKKFGETHCKIWRALVNFDGVEVSPNLLITIAKFFGETNLKIWRD